MGRTKQTADAAGKSAPVKMRRPDYWPALAENEKKALAQQEIDAERRRKIYADDCIKIRVDN